MKDATGELSMTAVAVVAIAAIGVVFSQVIWPTIKENIDRSARCSQAFNCKCTATDSICNCQYLNNSQGQNKTETVRCPKDK